LALRAGRPVLSLHAAATARDLLQAALQVAYLQALQQQQQQQPAQEGPSVAVGMLSDDDSATEALLRRSLQQARAGVDAFAAAAQAAGWRTDSVVMPHGPRVAWPQPAFGPLPPADARLAAAEHC
jgi:hypothetical protein